MKELSVREARAIMGQLEEIVLQENEIIITKQGHPIVRVIPIQSIKKRPSHKKLRESLPYTDIPAQQLIREDRDTR